jgi:hypothetical protein
VVVRCTTVPRSNCAEQIVPQEIPTGSLSIVPAFAGLGATVKVTLAAPGVEGVDGLVTGGATLGRLCLHFRAFFLHYFFAVCA